MNAQLNYMIARHLNAELQRIGQQVRLAHEAHPRRRKSPEPPSDSHGLSRPGSSADVVHTIVTETK